MTGSLLGGLAGPFGWCVQYLAAPPEAVIAELRDVPSVDVVRTPAGALTTALDALLPFESPWTRELVLPCGDWTAYLNNGLHGGDPTAHGIAVGRRLGVRCVVAQHAPRYGPGHQATQLWVSGPDGVPPLMDVRTISASATDGRWQWHTFGDPFPFEDVRRYRARRVRDRFDRPALLRLLHHLGIPADDDSAYGEAVLLQTVASWPRRSVTLEEALRELVGE